MKIQNALVSNMSDRSQRYFAHVTTVTLSWRVQNIVVISRVYFTLECFEFSSNFEFDRNMLSGTGARSRHKPNSSKFISSYDYDKRKCIRYISVLIYRGFHEYLPGTPRVTATPCDCQSVTAWQSCNIRIVCYCTFNRLVVVIRGWRYIPLHHRELPYQYHFSQSTPHSYFLTHP